jgi:hypothetical protein
VPGVYGGKRLVPLHLWLWQRRVWNSHPKERIEISSPPSKKAKMAAPFPMGSENVRAVVKKLCAKEELSGARYTVGPPPAAPPRPTAKQATRWCAPVS